MEKVGKFAIFQIEQACRNMNVITIILLLDLNIIYGFHAHKQV